MSASLCIGRVNPPGNYLEDCALSELTSIREDWDTKQ